MKMVREVTIAEIISMVKVTWVLLVVMLEISGNISGKANSTDRGPHYILLFGFFCGAG